MNTEIKILTDEWVEREARKRKQVPIAVFTIVAVHIVLFLGLLGSAGCKNQQAEAANGSTAEEMRDREFEAAAARSGHGPLKETRASSAFMVEEPVMAAPAVESAPAFQVERTRSGAKPVTMASASSEPGTKIYVVKPGDNLVKIARANGTTPKALKKANGLKSDLIRVGQKLRVS